MEEPICGDKELKLPSSFVNQVSFDLNENKIDFPAIFILKY